MGISGSEAYDMGNTKGLFTIELSLGLALFEFWRHLLGLLRAETWRKNSNSASLSLSSIANNPLMKDSKGGMTIV